jgi:hypothetical protein
MLLPEKVPSVFSQQPFQGYHDESGLNLARMDTVPRALIVSTVLLWFGAVSVLDMRIRFNYPERAPRVELLKINAQRLCGKICSEISQSQLRESSVKVPDWEALADAHQGHQTVY